MTVLSIFSTQLSKLSYIYYIPFHQKTKLFKYFFLNIRHISYFKLIKHIKWLEKYFNINLINFKELTRKSRFFFLTLKLYFIQYVHYYINEWIMEVTITDFRNNISTYFDKAYFDKEEIILKRRWYKLKIMPYYEEEKEDEKVFDSAVKSDVIRSKLWILASKL